MKLVPIAAGVVAAVMAFGGSHILNAGALACGITQATADRISASGVSVAQSATGRYATSPPAVE